MSTDPAKPTELDEHRPELDALLEQSERHIRDGRVIMPARPILVGYRAHRGYFLKMQDGSERGPFPTCPPAPQVTDRALEVQILLAQEPRP